MKFLKPLGLNETDALVFSRSFTPPNAQGAVDIKNRWVPHSFLDDDHSAKDLKAQKPSNDIDKPFFITQNFRDWSRDHQVNGIWAKTNTLTELFRAHNLVNGADADYRMKQGVFGSYQYKVPILAIPLIECYTQQTQAWNL